jgi:hypothetical protein
MDICFSQHLLTPKCDAASADATIALFCLGCGFCARFFSPAVTQLCSRSKYSTDIQPLVQYANYGFCLFQVDVEMKAKHAVPAMRIEFPENGVTLC